jgi:hypothetical protein
MNVDVTILASQPCFAVLSTNFVILQAIAELAKTFVQG